MKFGSEENFEIIKKYHLTPSNEENMKVFNDVISDTEMICRSTYRGTVFEKDIQDICNSVVCSVIHYFYGQFETHNDWISPGARNNYLKSMIQKAVYKQYNFKKNIENNDKKETKSDEQSIKAKYINTVSKEDSIDDHQMFVDAVKSKDDIEGDYSRKCELCETLEMLATVKPKAPEKVLIFLLCQMTKAECGKENADISFVYEAINGKTFEEGFYITRYYVRRMLNIYLSDEAFEPIWVTLESKKDEIIDIKKNRISDIVNEIKNRLPERNY